MKTTCTLLLLAFTFVSCHHDNRNDSRRYTPTRDYRRTNDTERRNTRTPYRTQRREEQRRTDNNMNALPYLPPFTMRWDCPTEPQLLGYMTR